MRPCWFFILLMLAALQIRSQSLEDLQRQYASAGDTIQKAYLLATIADLQSDGGDMSAALENAKKALCMADALHSDTLLKRAYNVIGSVYYYLGNYPLALQNHFHALSLNEKTRDEKMIAASLSNIGMVYDIQGNREKGLEYYRKALAINRHLKNYEFLSANLLNIGLIYVDQKKFAEALENFNQAIEIDESIRNYKGLSTDYSGIAEALYDQGKKQLALEFHLKAAKFAQIANSPLSQAISLSNSGNIYTEMKEFGQAEIFLKKALAISTGINDLEGIADVNQNLSVLFEKKGDAKNAFLHYKAYIRARDSIYNEEATKKLVQSEMNYEFEKKEAAAKAQQEKREGTAQADQKRQKMILFTISGFGLLVLGFAIFAYRSFLQKKKANIEISKQKNLIEEKQKEILDSIYYARRIQRSLLPSDWHISKMLKK